MPQAPYDTLTPINQRSVPVEQESECQLGITEYTPVVSQAIR